jgi:fatty acid desaturase
MSGMNAVPKELLRAAYQRKPIHLLKIPFLFGLWAAIAGALHAVRDTPWLVPVGVACSILVAYIVRGLGAVAHDAVHGNLSRNKKASYALSLLCWSPSGMSVTIYANYHLHHHRITNTYPDVDNFVVTDYTTNPTAAKVLLLCVYTFGYPIYFMFQMFRYMKRLTPWQRMRVNLELAGIFGLVGVAAYLLPLQVFLFAFGLPFALGAVLASLTSMIEHYGMSVTDDDAYSSRTYGTACAITNFLWNDVTYHNEHHKYPGIPFYNLASFHRAAYPHYDERVKAECHRSIYRLAFSLYREILRVDVEAQIRKYQHIDRQAERDRMMKEPGIPGAGQLVEAS